MARDGYIKFQRRGIKGKRLTALDTDGQRWRWWVLSCMADTKYFPGLLAESYAPFSEMEILGRVYAGREFKGSIKASFAAWEEDKGKLIEVGLLKKVVIEDDIFYCLIDFHAQQDKFSTKGKQFLRKFYEGFLDLNVRDSLVHIILINAIQPAKVDLEIFKSPLDRTLLRASTRTHDRASTRTFTLPSARQREESREKIVEIREKIVRYLHSSDEKKETNPDIKKFINWYCSKYKTIHKVPYNFSGKDASLIQKLLGVYDYKKLIDLAEKFFKTRDRFIEEAGRTVGVFYSQVNKLAAKQKGGASQSDNEPCRVCSSTNWNSIIDGVCNICRRKGKS